MSDCRPRYDPTLFMKNIRALHIFITPKYHVSCVLYCRGRMRSSIIFMKFRRLDFQKKKKKKTISACEYVKVWYVFNLPKQTNFKRNFLVLSQSVIIYFFSSPSWASGGMAAVVMDLTLAIISLVCEINGWVIY